MLEAVKAKPEPAAAAEAAPAAAAAAAAPAAGGAPKRRVRAAFAEDEEEAPQQRKLIPIRSVWAGRGGGAWRVRLGVQRAERRQRACGQPRVPSAAWLSTAVIALGSWTHCSHPRACTPPPPPPPARRYSDEEVRALHAPPEGQQQQGGAAAAPAAQQAPPAPVDPAALKKQLLGLIPKDKAGVFSFPLDWAVLEAAPPAVRDKISGAWAGGRAGGNNAAKVGAARARWAQRHQRMTGWSQLLLRLPCFVLRACVLHSPAGGDPKTVIPGAAAPSWPHHVRASFPPPVQAG